MMNRNITTPSSATCRIACGLVNSSQPERADDQAGGQVAQHRAEPGPLEQRNRDHRRAQQRDDMEQIGSLLRRRHLRSLALRSHCSAGLSKEPVHSQPSRSH